MRSYMEQMVAFRAQCGGRPEGWGYSCVEDYVLDRGVTLESAPLTPEEEAILWKAVDHCSVRFQQKQCFYNAQLLCLYDYSNSLQYMEGYASGNAIIPVHHGWATLNGKVIDLTWRTEKANHKGRLGNRIIGTIPEGWEYIGCSFSKEDARARMIESGEIRAFLGDYIAHFPRLSGERKSA